MCSNNVCCSRTWANYCGGNFVPVENEMHEKYFDRSKSAAMSNFCVYTMNFAKCPKNEQVFTHTHTLNWWTQVNVSTFRERHTESNGNNVTIHSMWCDRNSDDWNWLKCDVFGLCILAKLFMLLFFGISVDFSIRTEMNLLMSHQFNVLWIVVSQL